MSATPEADARRLMDAFQVEKCNNPDVLPYIGPVDTLNRFLAGAVVSKQDMLTDESPFTVQAVLPGQMRRLRWMLDNVSGEESR